VNVDKDRRKARENEYSEREKKREREEANVEILKAKVEKEGGMLRKRESKWWEREKANV
jgi:hypothetical protein